MFLTRYSAFPSIRRDKNAIKAVKRYSFEKDYHFKLRGFCTGQLVLASMEDQKIVCSHSAEKKRSFSAEDFRGKECRAKLKKAQFGSSVNPAEEIFLLSLKFCQFFYIISL